MLLSSNANTRLTWQSVVVMPQSFFNALITLDLCNGAQAEREALAAAAQEQEASTGSALRSKLAAAEEAAAVAEASSKAHEQQVGS